MEIRQIGPVSPRVGKALDILPVWHTPSLSGVHMTRLFRITVVSTLTILLFASQYINAAPKQINGDHVASIVNTFLRNHYNREKFDNDYSKRMFKNYLDRFDPGHYFFLESDLANFRKFETRLDNEVPRGEVDAAFLIFNTYRTRLVEREQWVSKRIHGKFDLKQNDTTILDRNEEPYPANTKEADQLWEKRLKFELLEQVLDGTNENDARENLKRRYHSIRIQIERYNQNDILSAFLNAFTAAYDPHSTYLSPDDLENFNISLRLSLEGIGATLRWEDGMTVVSSIIAGGAAWKEGTLKPEDRIISVSQGEDGEFEDVRNMRLIEVVKRIRGKRGTVVRLKALRKGENGGGQKRLTISIIRDKIALKEGEAKGEIYDRKAAKNGQPYKVGVINLPSFYVDFSKRGQDPNNYKSSSRDVEKIVRGFRDKNHVDAIVLDLRNNGGGGLQEAVSLSGLFLNPGPVVMVKTLHGRIETYTNPHRKPLYKGPLLVLTNRFSASASEILAGALQDYGRAIVVGERSTFGKGTVQNIIQLPQGLGALKTTVAKFYRPGSHSTQNKGVVPDIVLPSLNNHLEIGESAQDYALPWDSIRKALFTPWDDLSAVLPTLEHRSKSRLKKKDGFQKLQKRVDEYVAHQKKKKVISLEDLRNQKAKQEKEQKGEKKPDATAHGEKDKKKKLSDDIFLEEALDILTDYLGMGGGKSGRIANSKS